MARVTPDEVKEIVDTSLSDPVIETWIDSANTIVNSKADCIGGDESVLTQVELFLSAHFVALLNPQMSGQVKRTKIDVFETEFSQTGLSEELMNRTPYGVTANMLSGGCLISTTKAKSTVDFL